MEGYRVSRDGAAETRKFRVGTASLAPRHSPFDQPNARNGGHLSGGRALVPDGVDATLQPIRLFFYVASQVRTGGQRCCRSCDKRSAVCRLAYHPGGKCRAEEDWRAGGREHLLHRAAHVDGAAVAVALLLPTAP